MVEWDRQKADANRSKHGIELADAAVVLADELAITRSDDDHEPMKKYYDFSKGKRGAIIPTPPGKTRITIRIDDDILDWFREQVNAAGAGNYQTMMNQALRKYTEEKTEVKVDALEETLRRVLGEVMPASKPRKKATRRPSR